MKTQKTVNSRVGRSVKSNGRKEEGRKESGSSTLDLFKMVGSLGDGAYSKVYKVKRIVDE